MAHSRPDKIENIGDAWRITTAAGAFIIELMTDSRVSAQYEEWFRTRQHAIRFVTTWEERFSSAAQDLDEETKQRMWEGYHALIDAHTEQFVRGQLGLHETWIKWVAGSLLEGFQMRLHNEQHPNEPRQFTIPVRMLKSAPKGRRPRSEGQDIDRAVRWFYRAKVKNPPDSVNDLARDYASWANRDNDSRSVVQNGIAQVQALLDLVAERIVPA